MDARRGGTKFMAVMIYDLCALWYLSLEMDPIQMERTSRLGRDWIIS